MLQSRGFSAPKALLQKPLEVTFFLHTSYRACFNHTRLFDLYLSREVSAMLPTNWQKNATLGKKARSGF